MDSRQDLWDRQWSDRMVLYRARRDARLRADARAAALAERAEAGDAEAMAALRHLVWQAQSVGEPDEPPIHCLACGAGNRAGALFCAQCGASLEASSSQAIAGAAFLLNQLPLLEREGIVDPATHAALRQRYVTQLQPVTALPAGPVGQVTSVPAETRGPSVVPWLGEQAPNLLLYMGAFLVVMAGLVFINILALLPLTIGFLVAGWYCRRFPRVALTGTTYLAVGALLAPLNFVAAYFLLQAEQPDPQRYLDLLWLLGSAFSALFYGSFATLSLGRLYAWLSGAALLSTWAALLATLEVPVEWAPPLFVLLSLILAAAPRIGKHRRWTAFARTATTFAHVVTPAAVFFSAGLHVFGEHAAIDTSTRGRLRRRQGPGRLADLLDAKGLDTCSFDPTRRLTEASSHY